MDFDTVLLEIGEFGRYQQTNYLLLCLPVLFGAANSLSYVFTAGVPNYRYVNNELIIKSRLLSQTLHSYLGWD